MTYINITKFVRINSLEKDHSMIETRRSKNVVIFIATILRFVLSRKIINSKRLIAISQYKKYSKKLTISTIASKFIELSVSQELHLLENDEASNN